MDRNNENDKRFENPEEDNLINKNANPEWDSKREISDPHHSNVDPNKPQFERSNLQADQEKKAGSGGSGRNPDNK